MIRNDIFEKNKNILDDLLKEKRYSELSKELRRINPVDICEYMEQKDLKEKILIFRLLSKDDASEVFAEFDRDDRQELINGFNDNELTEVLNELNFDDKIDTLEEMPAYLVKRIIENTPHDDRKKINQFLKYPEDSAGSLMTTEYVELKKEMTCEEALLQIKKEGMQKVTVYTCYVTSEKFLLGYVSLRMIVTSEPYVKIGDLMFEDVISVNTGDDQENVAAVFRRYGFTALPVVDGENRLTGIITVDDIMEVMEQEATEDFHVMAAMTPEEDGYMETSVIDLAKNRIPRLLILLVSAAFTSTIMQSYEKVIQSVIALNMFIPMITDSGGNAGSQSSTLVIRSMATGDVGMKDRAKVVFKEFRVSIIVGAVMSAVAFLKALLFDKVELHVAATVGLTILFTIILSKLIGSVLPMIAKKMNFDPAIMASPLITTLVDSAGLLVYFNVARLIMHI